MIWKPHVTVAALIERDGHFLMVEEEDNGRVVYNQPAGHLDEGESLAAAVVRETLEETAWHFQPQAVTGIYKWLNPLSDITYLRVCFTGACDGHDADRPLDRGIRRALWMTQQELSEVSAQMRSPMVMRCIKDYLAGRRYPLHLLADL
ncbi:MAG: NUDIX hydrolase [Gammaproteobacteria bacterium]